MFVCGGVRVFIMRLFPPQLEDSSGRLVVEWLPVSTHFIMSSDILRLGGSCW